MASDLNQRARVNGVELAWDSWGAADAPALVLAHGFGGSAADFHQHVSPLVEAGRRVVLVEHRGHGRSGRSPADVGYRIAGLAKDLADFISQFPRPPVDLLGHSMGGRVALEVTLGHPEFVRSLILMDTSAWSFRPTDPHLARALEGFFRRYDPAEGLPSIEFESAEDALIAVATPAAERDARSALMARLDPLAFKQLGSELFLDESVSLRDRLGEVCCPVTVVVGEHDDPYADQAPELISLLHPAAALHVIPGAYHSPQLSHPAEWLAAVQDHFARMDPSVVLG